MNHPLDNIRRGVTEIIDWETLRKKIERQETLRIKVGFDPTAPDLHLGHTVLINKMRQFQILGHKVIFLIGDFTSQIGDPSGKNVTRQPLSAEAVVKNAATYATQVFKILDKAQTEVRFNSEWFNTFHASDLIQLASKCTVARMLERDDFSKRFKGQQAISIHEFLYPLIQGYDSIALNADVELGGTDQKFNLLMGRELQRDAGLSPQSILMMPLIKGLDGVRKMSKSYGNYIGIDEPVESIFGKIMSISDELMWQYFDVLSFRETQQLVAFKQSVQAGENPRNIKAKLGIEIVDRFYGTGAGEKALETFEARFRHGAIPDNLILTQIACDNSAACPIASVLKKSGLTVSTSESMRLIKQGAVKVDGQVVSDLSLVLEPGLTVILQVGKHRFAKVALI